MYANDAYQNTLRSHEHPSAQQSTLAFGVAFNRQHVRGILLMDAGNITHTSIYTAFYIYICFYSLFVVLLCYHLSVCLFVLSQAVSAFLPQPCYQFFSDLRSFSPPLLFDCLLARLLTFRCENYSYQ